MNEIDTTSSHYKGKFNNIYEVQEKYPNGGVDGDYVDIAGWAHYWEADRGTWCVNEKRDEYWDELITSISTDIGKLRDTDELFQKTINALGASGYSFAGVVNPDTKPGIPKQNIFYIATKEGDYNNFKAAIAVSATDGTNNEDVIHIAEGEIAFLLYDGYRNVESKPDQTAIPNGWKKVTLIKRHVIQEIESDDYDKLVKSGSVDENVYYTVFE